MTRDRFQSEMQRLGGEVEAMARHALAMLHDGIDALDKIDQAKGKDVVGRAERLATYDEWIETSALQVLMLQAPVARDLRRVGAILKLITYINRVGRYGYDVARIVEGLQEPLPKSSMVTIRQMARNVEEMLEGVIVAFHTGKPPETTRLLELEDDVDAQRYAVWRETLTYMAQDARRIESGSHAMMVARYLERCGDNIVKMAEKLHYAATGERILLK